MTKRNRDSLVAGGDGERDVFAQGGDVMESGYVELKELWFSVNTWVRETFQMFYKVTLLTLLLGQRERQTN